MHSIKYFEIHAARPEVIIDFYSRLFGWEFVCANQEGSYWVILERQADTVPMAGLKTRIGGDVITGRAFNAFIAIFSVESVENILKEAEILGGHVIEIQAPAPGLGVMSYIQDPDGNIFGICA